MDDRELFEILEGQGPWSIRFEDTIGKIFFSNGEKVIEVKLTVEVNIPEALQASNIIKLFEESIDSAPSVKWNGTLEEKALADSDKEQATETETKQSARDPNLWANVPEVISLDELKLFASQLDEDW
jgi:hypothetical protein